MKLDIQNGTLKACYLDSTEKTLRLPDDVRVIEENAFSQIPSGQIKHLFLPENLVHIPYDTFSGLGRFTSVTAYTYDFDTSLNGLGDIQTEKLILLP